MPGAPVHVHARLMIPVASLMRSIAQLSAAFRPLVMPRQTPAKKSPTPDHTDLIRSQAPEKTPLMNSQMVEARCLTPSQSPAKKSPTPLHTPLMKFHASTSRCQIHCAAAATASLTVFQRSTKNVLMGSQ
ncbi:hypothetical protein DMP23_00060 [Amycolatopsis sp. A1MSW2902]